MTDGSTDTDSGPDAGCITLTVIDAPTATPWCNISVNGGTAVLKPAPICVPSGTTVTLTATPESTTFELGATPWHDTAGDTGNGDPGTVAAKTSSTTVVVTSAKTCVWACCPFSSDGHGCPTTDQCP